MDFNGFVVILAAAVIAAAILKAFLSQRSSFPKNYMPYENRDILTRAERCFYGYLKEECRKRNLLVCPKVRLEDFIAVTDKNNQYKYRGYIKSRHVDFLICDDDMKIVCGIELDDSSHLKRRAKQTDDFKNRLFAKIDIPLYRISTKDDYEEKISQIFY